MNARSFADLARRQLRTTEGKADSRTNLIRAVRAAARRMGLSEDDRKAIQLQVVGKASMKDMTPAEIGRVLDRLNRDRPAPMGHRAHVGKIRALWWTLYWLGEVDDPNGRALDVFVKRQTKVSALRFLDHSNASSVIEALKSWAARSDVRWPTEASLEASLLAPAQAERMAVADAIWRKLLHIRAVDHPIFHSYAEKALGLPLNHHRWTPTEYDQVIRLLGKKLRRAMHKAAIDG